MKTKYLIVTADDFGLCRSVNRASIEALTKGCVTSLTIMAPAPYFKHAIGIAHKYNIRHLGVHLTLTSEFPNLRWGPISPLHEVPSLVDKAGYFWKTISSFAKHAKPFEIVKELDNQVMMILKHRIIPTHFDCHMFALHSEISKRPDFLPIILYLCKKYKIPFRSPFRKETLFFKKNNIKTLSNVFKETYDIPAFQKKSKYNNMLKILRPGISELILHCGYNNSELQSITKFSLRRKADLDYALSKELKDILKNNNIQLLSWAKARAYLD